MSSEAWFSAFHCEDVGQAELVQKYYKVFSFHNLIYIYMLWRRSGMLWVKCIFSGLWVLYFSYIYVWNIQWLRSAGLVSGTVVAILEVQVKEWLKAVKSFWFSPKFHIWLCCQHQWVYRQVFVLFNEFPLDPAEMSAQMHAWDVSVRVVAMRSFNFNIYFNTN